MNSRSPRKTITLIMSTVSMAGSLSAAERDLFSAPWLGYDASVYPQGYVSWAARAADLNSDGFDDLAVTSWYSNSRLSILLADQLGGYEPPLFHTLPLGALDVAAGDFDGDDDLDLVVPNTGQYWEGTTFQLWTNQGDGVFVPGGQFPCGAGPTGITVADFNQDGALDVAVAHDAYIVYGASIAIVRGDGAGGFMAPQVLSLDQGTYKIDSGDLDGDGDVDLAVAHETNQVTILYNTNGQFLLLDVLEGLPSSFGQQPTVAIADADADGDQDILYSHSGSGAFFAGEIAYYENPGDGLFGPPSGIPLALGTDGAVDIEVADVTGDGLPDLLGAQGASQSWTLVRGLGAGEFAPGEALRAGETPLAARAARVDGDDSVDVVVLGRDSMSVSVYRNPNQGVFEQPPVIDMIDPSFAPASFSNLAAGDIDQDGDLDLVVGHSANFNGEYGVTVRRNNGDGTFAARETYPLNVFPNRVLLRDMDNDTFVDLVWVNDDSPSRFRVRRNDQSGAFPTQVNGPSTSGLAGAIETGDVDNDGDLDVLIGSFFNLLVSRNNAGASYAAFQAHELDWTPTAIGLGDVNNDGALDVFTNTGPQGWAQLCLGDGNGGFGPPLTLECGRDVHAIAVGDINNDGAQDMVAAFNLDGTGLTVRLGLGDGSFLPSDEYYGSYSAIHDSVNTITLSDADGDGNLDALIPFFAAQEVDFWRGRGDGTFEEKVRYGVGRPTTDVAYGDFDGDGRGDLAALVEGTGAGAWYYPGVVLIKGAESPAATPGDVDKDGDVDLVDLSLLLATFGLCEGEPGFNADAQFDAGSCVDLSDLSILLSQFGA